MDIHIPGIQGLTLKAEIDYLDGFVAGVIASVETLKQKKIREAVEATKANSAPPIQPQAPENKGDDQNQPSA